MTPELLLNNNQKRVIVIIAQSPTAAVAFQQLQGNPNLVAAYEELAKLGFIEINGNELTLTPGGISVGQDENILDDSGNVTPEGQQFLQVRESYSLMKRVLMS